MDRRNGGDPLAPPRPPKLLPRVHRPRAPEPTMMSETSSVAAAAAAAAATATTATSTPLCTNISNNNNNNNSNQSQQHFHSINAVTISQLNNNNNINNANNVVIAQPALQQHHLLTTTTTTPLLRLHPHPHQQEQHQHQQQPATTSSTSLSRNNSSLSNTLSPASTVTATNSFARRRPPPATPTSPLTTRATTASPATASVPLLTVVNGNILSGSFLHSQEPVPVSPVTLAAPRPESERLTNEYVDTPFRTAQQLQHASRTQHPAGQNVLGQTTTQHVLLLQQSQNRQQQQQQQQNHQQHSSRVGTAGSATTSTATATATATTTLDGRDNNTSCDRVDAFLHSNSHKTPTSAATAAAGTGMTSRKPALSSAVPPPPPARPNAPNSLPITQPIITKQPAATTATSASNSFIKDPHQQYPAFHEDILDLHHIGGISTPTSGSSVSNGNAIGTPIIIGGSDAAALNPITCPRCDRCRCEQCQSPRQLPQTWVCNKTCLCSAETIIDYASCLCCVKALFYHCAKDHEMDCDDGATTLCVDDPCSCLPHKRTQRWGWLGALSVVLPCLWCYWPMRGCAAICEKCYGRYAGHGCRCQQIGSTSSMLPIVPLGINGSGLGGSNPQNGGGSMGNSKAGSGGGGGGGASGHHHHHHQRHQSECSAASRILRKCDLTPEKRLLDSSPEY